MKATWRFWVPAGGFLAALVIGVGVTRKHADTLAVRNGQKRPPKPSEVNIPAGWYRLQDSDVTPAMTAFATDVLKQVKPLGDLQTTTLDGKQVGAFTEWHWDDHVDNTLKWHRGVSILARSVLPGKVLLVGDSLAVGLDSHFAMLGVPHDKAAVIGTTVQYWASGQGNAALKRALVEKPDLVLVSLSANDAFVPKVGNGDIAVRETKSLLQQFKDAGAKVAWIGPPSLPPEYNGRKPDPRVILGIRETVLADPSNRWLDATGLNIPRAADLLHPTAAGYHLWAQDIINELQQKAVAA